MFCRFGVALLCKAAGLCFLLLWCLLSLLFGRRVGLRYGRRQICFGRRRTRLRLRLRYRRWRLGEKIKDGALLRHVSDSKGFFIAERVRSEHSNTLAVCASPSKQLDGARDRAVRGKRAWRIVTRFVQWETSRPEVMCYDAPPFPVPPRFYSWVEGCCTLLCSMNISLSLSCIASVYVIWLSHLHKPLIVKENNELYKVIFSWRAWNWKSYA